MGEALTAFKDIVGGFQGIATIGLAVYGLNAWHRDFLGKRQIELAEEVLALFYRAQDAIRTIRNPGSFPSEHEGRERPEDEEEHQTHVRNLAYVIRQRIQQQDELFSKLHSHRYQVMARFGRDKGEPFERFRRVVIRIAVAAGSYARVGSDRYIAERRRDLLDNHEQVFWEWGEDDEIQTEVKSIVTEIEGVMRPIIDKATRSRVGWIERLRGTFPNY